MLILERQNKHRKSRIRYDARFAPPPSHIRMGNMRICFMPGTDKNQKLAKLAEEFCDKHVAVFQADDIS